MTPKKGMTTNFLDPGSEIRDPGWVKIRIRDKHPGSATLVTVPVASAACSDSRGGCTGRWSPHVPAQQQRKPSSLYLTIQLKHFYGTSTEYHCTWNVQYRPIPIVFHSTIWVSLIIHPLPPQRSRTGFPWPPFVAGYRSHAGGRTQSAQQMQY